MSTPPHHPGQNTPPPHGNGWQPPAVAHPGHPSEPHPPHAEDPWGTPPHGTHPSQASSSGYRYPPPGQPGPIPSAYPTPPTRATSGDRGIDAFYPTPSPGTPVVEDTVLRPSTPPLPPMVTPSTGYYQQPVAYYQQPGRYYQPSAPLPPHARMPLPPMQVSAVSTTLAPPMRWPIFLSVGLAATIVGSALGYLLLSRLGQPDVLDNHVVATEALRIVREDFGLEDASEMSCPPDQEVTVNHTFVCTFHQGSHESSVQIVITDTKGSYQVGGAPTPREP